MPHRVRDRIASGETIYISFVSAWEYGIKRLAFPGTLPYPFDAAIAQLPHQPLACEVSLGRYAESLPLIHKDPFDRMLIAQAIHHRLTLVTVDETIRRYPVTTLW